MIRRRWLKHIAGIVTLGSLLLFAFTNCSEARIMKLPESQKLSSSTGISQICTTAPKAGTSDIVATKILFLVDSSGSNFSGNDERGTGTDPQKTYRVGKIGAFANAYVDNASLSYGLIAFQGGVAFPLIKDALTNAPSFTKDHDSVTNALYSLYLAPDQGATPYKAALTMAGQLITADRAVTAEPAKTRYVVLVMSDGAPTDYGSPVAAATVLGDVQAIKNIGPNITISTLYYGPEILDLDKAAVKLLKDMAERGGGKFLDTNVAGRESSIDNLVPLQAFVPRVIKQFMVTNLSSAPCDDGKMGPDSDSDGLCDRDEERYNEVLLADPVMGPRMRGNYFNPTNRNSFGNNYSDYFNSLWVRYGLILDRTCGGVKTTAHDLLTDCEKLFLSSESATGAGAKWSLRMGKVADINNYDSDGDGFLDSIETIYGRSLASALNFSSGSTLVQGHRADEILLQHRHPGNPAASAPYDPDFRSLGANELGQNCYSYSQTVMQLEQTAKLPEENTVVYPQLAHKAGENVIFAYYIEVPENDVNSPGELHYLFRKVKFDSKIDMKFSQDEFEVFAATNAIVLKETREEKAARESAQ